MDADLWADRIVTALIADLCDRRGLKHEWQRVHPEIQEEIRQEWRAIVARELRLRDAK